MLVLLGRGDGTFEPERQFAVLGSLPSSVALGDVNDDDRLDVVTANESAHVSVLLGLGDGVFDLGPLHR